MAKTLSIRARKRSARQVRNKARVKNRKTYPAGIAMQRHINACAGTWDGYCSGEELLRRTRS